MIAKRCDRRFLQIGEEALGLLWHRMKRPVLTVLAIAASLVALSPAASAYYYLVYFASSTGPFTVIPAKFASLSIYLRSFPT